MKFYNICYSLVIILLVLNNLVLTRRTTKKFVSKTKTGIEDLPYIATNLPFQKDVSYHDFMQKLSPFNYKDKLQAYIGYLSESQQGEHTTPPTLIVYWRGSANLDNWLQNIKFSQVKYDDNHACTGECSVHKGFYKSFLKIKPKFFEAYNKIIDEIKKEGLSFPKEIIFTGHSMGGALTTFNALSFLDAKEKNKASSDSIYNIPDVSLITFGAPRVGNPVFANFINSLNNRRILKRNYRVVYKGDPVPKIPPQETKIKDHSNFVTRMLGIDMAVKLAKSVLEKKNFPYLHAGYKIAYPETKYPEGGKRDEMEEAFKNVKPVLFDIAHSDPHKPSKPMETLISGLKKNFKKHGVYGYFNGDTFWDFILKHDK